MEKDNQKNVVNNFEAGSNCQVFNPRLRVCHARGDGQPARAGATDARRASG